MYPFLSHFVVPFFFSTCQEQVKVGAKVSNGHAGDRGKGIGAVLLLSALAVHSLVETAALGVQSTAKSAYLITASIGMHATVLITSLPFDSYPNLISQASTSRRNRWPFSWPWSSRASPSAASRSCSVALLWWGPWAWAVACWPRR